MEAVVDVSCLTQCQRSVTTVLLSTVSYKVATYIQKMDDITKKAHHGYNKSG